MNCIQNYGMTNYQVGFHAKKPDVKFCKDRITELQREYKYGQITAEQFMQKIMALIGNKNVVLKETQEAYNKQQIGAREFSKNINSILYAIV